MNDAIVCEKCGYDLFMINPDGLTVCNQCGEFSTVPNVPPAIDDETKRMVLEQTNTKAAEPAQSVPAFWASENILKDSLRDNISCVLTTTKCAANTMPLYTVPPAIDETRHKLILVCEYLETVGLMFVSPRVISSQIRAILEAGNGE